LTLSVMMRTWAGADAEVLRRGRKGREFTRGKAGRRRAAHRLVERPRLLPGGAVASYNLRAQPRQGFN